MSDQPGIPDNGSRQPLPTLRIEIRPDGKGVNVHGPLHNKLLCWRMLTDAAAAILNFKAPSEIVVPQIQVPPDIGKQP